MHPIRLLAVALLLGAALVSCGDDDTVTAPSDGDGISDDTQTPDGAGTEETGDGWSDAEIESLVAMEVVGFTNLGGQVTAGNGTADFETDDGSLSAFVTIAACDPFICAPLVDPDETMMDNLRSSLARVHLDNPDLVFEAGLTTLPSGTEALTTYALSYVSEDGSTATAHSLTVRTQDERNAVAVRVSPADPFGYGDVEALEAAMDRDEAIDVADRLVDAFLTESG